MMPYNDNPLGNNEKKKKLSNKIQNEQEVQENKNSILFK